MENLFVILGSLIFIFIIIFLLYPYLDYRKEEYILKDLKKKKNNSYFSSFCKYGLNCVEKNNFSIYSKIKLRYLFLHSERKENKAKKVRYKAFLKDSLYLSENLLYLKYNDLFYSEFFRIPRGA